MNYNLVFDMSDKALEQNRIRSLGAESVELPADKWLRVIEELQTLRKFVFDVDALFSCTDGLLQATGECHKRICNLIPETGRLIHAIKYAEVEQ